MHKALHGDVVLARVTGVDRRGRLDGSIVEVLERANKKVVGRIFMEHGVAFLIAENKRINQDILITPDSLKGAKGARSSSPNHRAAEQERRADRARVEILGNYATPGWRSRSRCASTICRTSGRAKSRRWRSGCLKTVDAKDLKGRKDAQAAVRDDRWRDGEGFRRCLYTREREQRLQALGRHRGCEPVRKPGDPLDRGRRTTGQLVYFRGA